MRNRVMGIIGILWGGGMLVSFFMRREQIGGGAYGAGQVLALLLSVAMLGAGFYYLLNSFRRD